MGSRSHRGCQPGPGAGGGAEGGGLGQNWGPGRTWMGCEQPGVGRADIDLRSGRAGEDAVRCVHSPGEMRWRRGGPRPVRAGGPRGAQESGLSRMGRPRGEQGPVVWALVLVRAYVGVSCGRHGGCIWGTASAGSGSTRLGPRLCRCPVMGPHKGACRRGMQGAKQPQPGATHALGGLSWLLGAPVRSWALVAPCLHVGARCWRRGCGGAGFFSGCVNGRMIACCHPRTRTALRPRLGAGTPDGR